MCIFVCAFERAYIYIYTYKRVYTYIYVCMCVCVCVCASVSVRVIGIVGRVFVNDPGDRVSIPGQVITRS